MSREQGRPIALTRYIDAYVKEVPLVWEVYLNEKTKGTEQVKAERAAMRSIYPADQNIGVRLTTWKKHKFWPESATQEIKKTWETFRASLSRGIEQDEAETEAVKVVLRDYPHAVEALEIWKKCGVWSDESARDTTEYRDDPSMSRDFPGTSEGTSRMTDDSEPNDNPKTSSDSPGMSRTAFGLSKDQNMVHTRALLDEITVEERKWFGKATGKAPEEAKFEPIGAKLPRGLVLEFKSLPGRRAHHLERAMKLYLMVLKSSEK